MNYMGGLESQRAYRNCFNGSRRISFVASIMDLQVMYVNARGMRYEIFEESEEGDRQIRCLKHNPEKTKHRCSPENRRSDGELQVVQGSEEQVGGEPSFLLSVRSTAHTKASQNSTGPRAT